MLRWFLGTLGVLLIFGSVFYGGMYVGKLQCANNAQANVIDTLQGEVKGAEARGKEDAERAAQLAQDKETMVEWAKANAAKRIDIGGDLKRALGAMDLSLCKLGPDVQRVRIRAQAELVAASNSGASDQDKAGARAP